MDGYPCPRTIAWLGLVLSLVTTNLALATVAGNQPTQIASFQVFGDTLATGNTLMVPTDPSNEEVNNFLLDSSEAFVSGFPCDGTLEGAFLFWTGSIDIGIDDTADVTLADGSSHNDVVADMCMTVPSMGGFYYCRADVTALIQGHTSGCGYNGMYVVGDVEAMEGDYNSPDPNNGACFAQGKYAAWSLVLVYSEPMGFTRRDIIIYDGFLQLDEDSYNPGCGMNNPTPGVDYFSISGFEVGDPARGKLIYFGLEGDDQLGVPPQGAACPTCYDYFKFNGTKLHDAAMYPNNVFNGSTSLTGVDIDQFDIGETGFNLLVPGQTSANIEVGSGDGCVSFSDPGCPPEAQGGGESFFLGWMVVSLDTFSPLFIENSYLQFDEHALGAGDSVWASIHIQNNGNLPATDVFIWNTLPAGLEYVPNTTEIVGEGPVPDVGGTSPLYTPSGLSLGFINWAGPDSTKTIRLQVKVRQDQTNGTVLCSSATVDCDEIEPAQTAEDCVIVQAPDIADPVLEAEDVNGGFWEPGDIIRYRAILTNNGDQRAENVVYTMDLPPYVRDLNFISLPSGADSSNSTSSGGANGTGTVDVRNITIYGISKDSVEIIFDVIIFTEAELLSAGVGSTEIDGLQLPAQGLIAGPSMPADLPTNLVIVVLTYRPILDGTRKTSFDINGGRLEPGDKLRYTIEVHNIGNRPGTITITDDLPAGVTNCAIVSGPPSSACVPPPAGANGTGQVTAAGFTVPPNGGQVNLVFEVDVDAAAVDGLQVTNSALVEVEERPEENRTVTAPTLTVFNRAQFNVAEKTVQDMNGGDFEPGDLLTFNLRFINDGNRTATNVLISDQINPNLINVIPGQGGIYAGGEITWTIASILPGQEVNLSFVTNINAPLANGTMITNRAALDANEVVNPPVLTNLVSFTVISAPDLSVTTKSVVTQDLDGDSQVSPGDRVDYTIVVRNTGNAVATNVVVTDDLDSNLENIVVGQGGVLAGNTITWNLGNMGLSPAGDVTLTISATIVIPLEDGTLISNQAFASADQLGSAEPSDDPATAPDNDSTDIVVHSQAEVTATKTVSDQNGGDAMPGDTLVYIITVNNSGNAPADDLIVTDILPGDLENPVAGQGGQVVGNTITWSSATTPELVRLMPSTPVVLSFTADLVVPLADQTLVCNQGSISGSGFIGPVVTDDPGVGGLLDPTCLTVRSYPVLSESTKIAMDIDGDGHFNPGDRVRYQIDVRNSGTEVVNNLTVTDQLPANLINLTIGQNGSEAAGLITWSSVSTPALATILPDGVVTLTFEADIVLPLANGTQIVNQGQITSQEVPGPTGTDDPATPLVLGDPTIIVVESAPDLTTSTKNVEDLTGDPTVVEPGDTLRYTILVVNAGTEIGTDIIVRDTIDANLENIVPGQNGVFDGTEITWNSTTTAELSSLSPLDPPVSLSFTAQVVVPTQNGTIIENQAFLQRQGDPEWVPTDDPRTALVDDPTRVTVVSGSNLTSSSKIVFDDSGIELPPRAQVIPGQTISYSLTLLNEGNDSARNVIVRDPVDLTQMAIDLIGEGGRLIGDEIVWNYLTNPGQLGQIDPGQQVTLTFTATLLVPLDNGTEITNQGFISATDIASEIPTDDLRTIDLDDPVVLLVLSAPNLSQSTKTVEDLNGGDYVPGDTVRYRIRLINTGDAQALNVSLSDVINPDWLENIIPDQGGVFVGSTIQWDQSSTPALLAIGLSPAGDVELSFTAEIKIPLDDHTLVSNQASFSIAGIAAGLSDDPSTPADDDPTIFEIRSAPDLADLTKSVLDQNGGDPVPGDLLTYTIAVNNIGTMTARNVVISDPVDETNLVDITPLDGGLLSSGTIQWDSAGTPALLEVKPQDVVNLRFSARIKPLTSGGTIIDNQAQATSDIITIPQLSDDPSTALDDDPTRLIVIASPEFGQSTKTVADVNGAQLLPGEVLVFDITIRNTGNTFASNVVVSDPIDENLTNILPGQSGRLENDRIIWDSTAVPSLARMDPGDEIQLIFEATVVDSALDGTIISNRAEIDCLEFDQLQYTNQVQITVSTPVLSTTTKVVEDLNGYRPKYRLG
ncbi:MAG: DUF11 domain-containing protein [Deltaproteobacteria bacterium]|nr:DUF11 domain-containing protein [Deltaproteobacteria bacterium]